MTDSLRLLACQIDIPPMTSTGERDTHLARSARLVGDRLASEPADLVVLPELSTLEYARETFDCLKTLAEPLDGPSFQCWRAVAREHGCFVSYSFARDAGDRHHISIAVVDPNGELVGHYDKIHMAQFGASMEKDYFDRGNHLLAFNVKGFRVAPIICYDIRIPELSRTLTIDHNVDLILHCGAYYRDESFATWHAFATTRALENQVFFLSLNRAGAHYGNSVFCWPWMDENQEPVRLPDHDEELRLIELEKFELASAREGYSFLKDRLDDYGFKVLGNS